MEFVKYELQQEMSIGKIVTFYYMETSKHFYSQGEKHDFWEFVYVDKGEVEIYTDSNRLSLEQGDIVFYKPNEFHMGHAINGTALNLIIVSFDCEAPSMKFFEGMSFRLEESERAILSHLVREGLEAFDPPIDSPKMSRPKRNPQAPYGCEQLIKNYLEILLIRLIRKGASGRKEMPTSIAAENKDGEVVQQMIAMMKQNLSRDLTVDDFCGELAMGKTSLKTIFKAKVGVGIMEYFNKLKIEHAKLLIREKDYNFTEIAEQLGYSSMHYFSRQFKRVTTMTPTEYARSIKARSGRNTDR
ncbi:helix-turn-helix domain-containing protein [Paenibacillus sp. MBLB4367]|uniref:AraC family transcriptional regulator n=1 Tax=Paenibacillus sp. MBLB4367 TaxID=3384767 RepID=UPI00390811C7